MTSSLDIVERLNTDDDLIEAVISEGCFTSEQLENVRGAVVERSTKLLDKIKRSSMATLNRFLRCLRLKRSHVVQFLDVAGKFFSNSVDLTSINLTLI